MRQKRLIFVSYLSNSRNQFTTNANIVTFISKKKQKTKIMDTNYAILTKLEELSSMIKEIKNRVIADDEELVNIHVAASILGKTEDAIRAMVYRGQINCKHLKNGRLAFNKKYLKNFYTQSAI